jgi:hypothetical protein
MSMDTDVDHKYYLSAHNLTAKQPTIVNVKNFRKN